MQVATQSIEIQRFFIMAQEMAQLARTLRAAAMGAGTGDGTAQSGADTPEPDGQSTGQE